MRDGDQPRNRTPLEARHEGSRWRAWRASSLCHTDNEKETEGSFGGAEPRAAARGEISLVAEKQSGQIVTTDAQTSRLGPGANYYSGNAKRSPRTLGARRVGWLR